MLNIVSPGATFQTEAFFINANSTTFVVTTPVTYVIRDFNQKLVLSGTAIQDNSIPSRWHTTISLPENLLIGEDSQKYSLIWTAKNTKETKTLVETFNVLPVKDYLFLESDKVVLEKSSISEALIVAGNVTLNNVNFRIKDSNGEEIYTQLDIEADDAETFEDKQVLVVTTEVLTNLVADNTGMSPYVIEWTYTLNNVSQPPEYHFIYVINTKFILAMNDLRKFIDKARNADLSVNLQYTDVDLAHYIQQGLAKINFYPPQLTNWTITSLPISFKIVLTYAAAYEALNARLLAEGESNFDFSGQSVSLNVDRTQALESALSRVDSWLEQNLSKAKKLYAKSSSSGMLGLGIGPSTNRIRSANHILNRIRLMGGQWKGTNLY